MLQEEPFFGRSSPDNEPVRSKPLRPSNHQFKSFTMKPDAIDKLLSADVGKSNNKDLLRKDRAAEKEKEKSNDELSEDAEARLLR